MAVEYWSQEELEEYHKNPNIFIQRANEMRARMICDLLLRLKNRIMSFFK